MYNKNNVFYKILQSEIPAKKVFENDVALAFYDINPMCKIHVLVVSKGLYRNFEEFVRLSSAEEMKKFFETVSQIAEEVLGLGKSGYRILTNTGHDAGQEVEHFHVHILGGERL